MTKYVKSTTKAKRGGTNFVRAIETLDGSLVEKYMIFSLFFILHIYILLSNVLSYTYM